MRKEIGWSIFFILFSYMAVFSEKMDYFSQSGEDALLRARSVEILILI